MGSKVVEVYQENLTYRLTGCFDKFTIPEKWDDLKKKWQLSPPEVINLSGVEECDSALIALLVEAKRISPNLTIDSIPDNLVKLLELYQVKDLLS